MPGLKLPLSGRRISTDTPPFTHAGRFFAEVAQRNELTSRSAKTALRIFADWLQVQQKGHYLLTQDWPLDPDAITEPLVMGFRAWCVKNRSHGTAGTYLSGIMRYLAFLEGIEELPPTIKLGRLQRQVKRNRPKHLASKNVVEKDQDRQRIPELIEWFMNQPLPPPDGYGRRKSLLRNRAIVQTLMSTAMRISEVLKVNRGQVADGQATVIITGKGGKSRTVHIDDQARKAIDDYLDVRDDHVDALFVAHSRNYPFNRLTVSTLETVIKVAGYTLWRSSLRDRAIITLLRNSDATASELERLNCEAFDEEDGTLCVSLSPITQVLDLDEDCVMALSAWLASRDDQSNALFPEWKISRWDGRVSALVMAKMVIEAGEKLPPIFPNTLTAHDFRHYRAVQLLRAGVPLEVVQEYLGHADPSTTRTVYAPVLGASIVGDWLEKVGR